MNVVVYARYSSYSQREESIEGQLRECREYADRNGMTVVVNRSRNLELKNETLQISTSFSIS